MIMYELIEYQLPTTSLFLGETGSGKTEIWRQLQKAFTDARRGHEGESNIKIVDASQLCASGWKGDLHLSDCLRGFPKGMPFYVLVFDEFDKIWHNRNTDVNYADLMQSQLLKLAEHEDLGIPDTVPLDCLSIVFCGAFSSIYEQRHSKKGSIGFTSEKKEEKSDNSIQDELRRFGLKNELIGRLDHICEMQPANLDVYKTIAKQELQKLEENFHKEILISDYTLEKIAEEALSSHLGGRFVKRELLSRCEDALYNDCFCKIIQIEDCPAAEM